MTPPPNPTLFAEIEAQRPYLMRYAVAKLRDNIDAEEVVQETMLAALGGAASFAGDSTLRTWLTSILKFKIIDFQRRVSTERERFQYAAATSEETSEDWFEPFFDETGHWRQDFTAWAMPEAAYEQQAFFAVFERCMDKLPKATSRVFFQREVLGTDTDEICKDEGISASNCWVILHRARLSLRECLDQNWFGK